MPEGSANIGQLVATLLLLAWANEQVVENALGSYLSGRWIKLGSLGTGVGITFAAWYLAKLVPELAPLAALKPGGVVALGFVVGLGSNTVHALLGRIAPGAGSFPLLKMPEIRLGVAPPAAPPAAAPVVAPPSPPSAAPAPSSPVPATPPPPATAGTGVAPPRPMDELDRYVSEVNELLRDYRDGRLTVELAKASYLVLRSRYPSQPDLFPPGWPVTPI